MEERQIGATELRQKLTDVIQAVKEEGVAYVVETFGRPQAVLIDLDEYQRLRRAQAANPETSELAQAAFGMWRGRSGAGDGDDTNDWAARNRRWYSDWTAETGESDGG